MRNRRHALRICHGGKPEERSPDQPAWLEQRENIYSHPPLRRQPRTPVPGAAPECRPRKPEEEVRGERHPLPPYLERAGRSAMKKKTCKDKYNPWGRSPATPRKQKKKKKEPTSLSMMLPHSMVVIIQEKACISKRGSRRHPFSNEPEARHILGLVCAP